MIQVEPCDVKYKLDDDSMNLTAKNKMEPWYPGSFLSFTT